MNFGNSSIDKSYTSSRTNCQIVEEIFSWSVKIMTSRRKNAISITSISIRCISKATTVYTISPSIKIFADTSTNFSQSCCWLIYLINHFTWKIKWYCISFRKSLCCRWHFFVFCCVINYTRSIRSFDCQCISRNIWYKNNFSFHNISICISMFKRADGVVHKKLSFSRLNWNRRWRSSDSRRQLRCCIVS